jgi:hypothetical protein
MLAACMAVPLVSHAQIYVEPGLGCEFGYMITLLNAGNQQSIDNTARTRKGQIILAGESYDVLFTADSGQTYTLKGKGGAQFASPNPDGTYTYRFSGNYVLIWFPADDPTGAGGSGPESWITTGNVTLRSDTLLNGPWVLTSSSGRRIDLCALLSM